MRLDLLVLYVYTTGALMRMCIRKASINRADLTTFVFSIILHHQQNINNTVQRNILLWLKDGINIYCVCNLTDILSLIDSRNLARKEKESTDFQESWSEIWKDLENKS